MALALAKANLWCNAFSPSKGGGCLMSWNYGGSVSTTCGDILIAFGPSHLSHFYWKKVFGVPANASIMPSFCIVFPLLGGSLAEAASFKWTLCKIEIQVLWSHHQNSDVSRLFTFIADFPWYSAHRKNTHTITKLNETSIQFPDTYTFQLQFAGFQSTDECRLQTPTRSPKSFSIMSIRR